MAEPNPPNWPENNVLLIYPSDESNKISLRIKNRTKTLISSEGQFSDDRVALLFHKGTYTDVQVPVGYYVQALGLGKNVGDVIFEGNGGVYANAASTTAGSLDTFWRGAENFTNNASCPDLSNFGPTINGVGMLWAVSQAAPLRRIIVNGSLLLSEGGEYASGGFAANIQVRDYYGIGSQQQWISRNSSFLKKDGITGGAWSIVYAGCLNAPPTKGKDSTSAVSNQPELDVTVEKPFISSENGKYYLQIPKPRLNSSGPNFDENFNDSRPFEQVYLAKPADTTNLIQSKLTAGYDIVFSPGIYYLSKALEISKDNQVLLGIGLATLVASRSGCIYVHPNYHGIRIAGLMLQASIQTDYLLRWGDPYVNDNDDLSKANPSVISDLYVRVGGPDTENRTLIGTTTMVQIHSNYVIGDNLWLWRADHSKLATNEIPKPNQNYHLVEYSVTDKSFEFKCDNGLIVTGDYVLIYGLAVEHTLKDLTIW
eukprot:CAMPEP_0196764084 /NCGR_PEP_ID=MMETSP1095-20130614/5337_1 /TAXON_ID=96789 ORGANISM="Chromulina nebulosa, Strain UTEXLB2642" /NCGR_SAMPLE_ID=MMETSP1095 /ASSEMBLY_ACC=CAM_ASM_000446 /LENGTH=482 /DNA_ID=CAMNT_0042118703 /DNA_START=204 /DNA_END=1649 /DNA_ORIENTATION=+